MRWNDYVNTYANKKYSPMNEMTTAQMEAMVQNILKKAPAVPMQYDYTTDYSDDHSTSYFGPPKKDEITQSHIKHLNSQISSMKVEHESKIRTLTKQVSELTDSLKELKDSYDVLMDEVGKLIKANR